MGRPPSQVMRFDHLLPPGRCAGAQAERPAAGRRRTGPLLRDRPTQKGLTRGWRGRRSGAGGWTSAWTGRAGRPVHLRVSHARRRAGFLAPLALTGTQGCPIERNDAAHAKDESGEDADQREEEAGMDLTVQPLARHQPQSHADRERDAELRCNGERLRGGQPWPFETWGR
jgi:hypothetical protein